MAGRPCQRCSEKDAQLATRAAENLTLRMQCEAQENILSYYNGSCEEMGKLIDDMSGGLVARLKRILARHGVVFAPERRPLQ